jgi:hypothetical protein
MSHKTNKLIMPIADKTANTAFTMIMIVTYILLAQPLKWGSLYAQKGNLSANT